MAFPQEQARDQRLLEILKAHERPLARLIASYTRTAAERDDLAQEIAMALVTALPRFRAQSSEKTFVLRVAHNRAMSFLAKRGMRTEDIDEQFDVAETTGRNPAMRFERLEAEHRLLTAVRALPVGHRRVVTLLLEGLSHAEIAEVIGTTENNIAVRATRARAALRVLMEGGAS